MWLQSLDEQALALPIIKPEYIVDEYAPDVEDELVYKLGENVKSDDLMIFVTMTVPSDLTKMTCNLKAPIIINTATMKAVQAVAANEDYVVRFPVYNLLKEKKKRRVSRNAGVIAEKDEAIIINDNIEVKILEIKGDQIKIGVSAPKSVPIYRKEVFTQIQEANKEASESVDMEKLKKLF